MSEVTTPATNPSDLPSLPLAERKRLPDTVAIYVVMAGDTVLYVGQSANLRQRWLAHHRLKQLNKRGGCRIAWMQVDDATLLDELERACIAHFSPVLNNEPIPEGSRQTSAGYTWASTHLPIALADDIKRVAHKEQRTVSFMVRILCAEALQACGELTARTDDESTGEE